jgi:hypothetical protein
MQASLNMTGPTVFTEPPEAALDLVKRRDNQYTSGGDIPEDFTDPMLSYYLNTKNVACKKKIYVINYDIRV